MHTRSRLLLLVGLAALGLIGGTTLSACGGSDDHGQGILRIALTDAPACGYEAVQVQVVRVSVHASATASEADPGWTDVALAAPRSIDLLSLQNGLRETLGEVTLPAGTYAQLRLILGSHNVATPTGGSKLALSTPSEMQGGLKLQLKLVVSPERLTELVIDFDACKSIVPRGKGAYALKPVLTAVSRMNDAGQRVQGHAAALAGATIALQKEGVVVKSTVADGAGGFALDPVAAGRYDLVVSAPGRLTAVLSEVPVSTTAITDVDLSSLAAAWTPAGTATISGQVTPAAANARVLQTIGGHAVEVKWLTVDGDSGAFGAALPLAAPLHASWTSQTTALSWTADATAAGQYALHARLDRSELTQAVDLNAAVDPVVFSFP